MVSQAVKELLWKRQQGCCSQCDIPMEHPSVWKDGSYHEFGATVDHILATTLGGTDDISNLALVHMRCNTEKGWHDVRPQDADKLARDALFEVKLLIEADHHTVAAIARALVEQPNWSGDGMKVRRVPPVIEKGGCPRGHPLSPNYRHGGYCPKCAQQEYLYDGMTREGSFAGRHFNYKTVKGVSK